MKVEQFKFNADNLGYLVHSNGKGLVIDGGAVYPILDFAQKSSIKIELTANTHNHFDHTIGTKELTAEAGAQHKSMDELIKDKQVELDGQTISILHTPGHTEDSVCFHYDGFLISGDTLFNGTIGNCFTGDLNGYFKSLKMLMELPGETIVYSGHDYVDDSIAYARTLEPSNPKIDDFMEKYTPYSVKSTIKDELEVNPFLRFNQEPMIALFNKQGLPCVTEFERFKSLMTL